MFLLIALLCIAIAYSAAEALNRAANLTLIDQRPYPATSK
jgi:hypothetical protein